MSLSSRENGGGSAEGDRHGDGDGELMGYGEGEGDGGSAGAPRRRFLVSGSRDKTVKLWNATVGQCLMTFVSFFLRFYGVFSHKYVGWLNRKSALQGVVMAGF